MPVSNERKIRSGLQELGNACVIAGSRAGKIVQMVPELAPEMNDAMSAFNKAFQSLKKANAKLAELVKKGAELANEDPA